MRGPTVWVFAKTPCTDAPPTILAQTTGGALLYMFVVSGHLHRPLLSSQSWELGGKILGGFGTHPPTFFGAGLSILVFF